ncbi:MAG: EAL domain-containing protein [Parvularculaceae bacterium]|nr:EAL domain-containing protein [Parvularculaceae bacterium]
MHLFSIFAVEAAAQLSDGGAALGKGAIVGAVLAGLAFLAGASVLRASSAAFCAMLMVLTGGALEAVWLGLVPTPGPSLMYLMQGVFAASALIFVSSSIHIVRSNALLGGVMFAAALCVLGVSVINVVLTGEATGLLRLSLTGVAVTAVGLSAYGAYRGDAGARLILPGALAAAAAPLLLGVSAAGPLALAPHALFAIGILGASLGSLVDSAMALGVSSAPGVASTFETGGHERAMASYGSSTSGDPRVSENQLAQVLDYAGVAVWDWSAGVSHQTLSFGEIMGADGNGDFTPDAFKAFVHADDIERFLKEIYGDDDGGFDEIIKLQSGQRVRMRGARAIDAGGALERIVVFLEEAPRGVIHSAARDDALKLAAASLTGAAAAMPKAAARNGAEIAAAMDRGELEAAFQPIVSFDDKKSRGSEALVRWSAKEGGVDAPLSTEEIVRSAISAGKGKALAKLMIEAAAEHVAGKIKNNKGDYFAAFNVSPAQVLEEGFVDDVRSAIDRHSLPAKSLVLELTEADSLSGDKRFAEIFKDLSAAGVALAFDDFGAGYSSLSNLHKFDFDYLKVDKSFINDIVADAGKKKVVSALVGLARDFGMTVIAEGIETQEAADLANEIGCDLGQGYHLGAPSIKRNAQDSNSADNEMVLDKSLKADKGKNSFLTKKNLSFSRR